MFFQMVAFDLLCWCFEWRVPEATYARLKEGKGKEHKDKLWVQTPSGWSGGGLSREGVGVQKLGM